jgi:hypothetical protein
MRTSVSILGGRHGTATGCPLRRFGDPGAGGRVVNRTQFVRRPLSLTRGEGGTGRPAAGGCHPGAVAGAVTNTEVVMENEAAEQHWLESMAAQQTLMRMSDKPGQWRDPMAPFKALMKAQRDALSGNSEGDYLGMKF